MYLSQGAEKLPNLLEDPVEEPSYCYPELLALNRHDHFVQFLRDEWAFAEHKPKKRWFSQHLSRRRHRCVDLRES